MTDWTLYLEADITVSPDEVARVGDVLTKGGLEAVMAPAPVLGARFHIHDEPLPTRALGAVQGQFELAVRRALRTRLVAEDRDDDVNVTRVEMAQGAAPGWVPRGLTTAAGLATRLDYSEAWVRQLMRYKGAPDPVKVEGDPRVSIYDTEAAVRFLTEIKAQA